MLTALLLVIYFMVVYAVVGSMLIVTFGGTVVVFWAIYRGQLAPALWGVAVIVGATITIAVLNRSL